jgi:hypothetical protein
VADHHLPLVRELPDKRHGPVVGHQQLQHMASRDDDVIEVVGADVGLSMPPREACICTGWMRSWASAAAVVGGRVGSMHGRPDVHVRLDIRALATPQN